MYDQNSFIRPLPQAVCQNSDCILFQEVKFVEARLYSSCAECGQQLKFNNLARIEAAERKCKQVREKVDYIYDRLMEIINR